MTVGVRFASRFGDDPPSTGLPDDTRAVSAEPYVDVENGAGAITFMDVQAADIRRLDGFDVGDEVFVESDDRVHVFDSETEEARQSTHIWWRAVLVRDGPSYGNPDRYRGGGDDIRRKRREFREELWVVCPQPGNYRLLNLRRPACSREWPLLTGVWMAVGGGVENAEQDPIRLRGAGVGDRDPV